MRVEPLVSRRLSAAIGYGHAQAQIPFFGARVAHDGHRLNAAEEPRLSPVSMARRVQCAVRAFEERVEASEETARCAPRLVAARL